MFDSISSLSVNVDVAYYDLDDLTGVLTRKAFRVEAENVYAGAKKCAVLFIDLNKFKAINDICGHAKGDEFLRKTGSYILDKSPINSIIGRFGGDEFVLVIPDIEYTSVELVVSNILQNQSIVSVSNADEIFYLSMSIGVYYFDKRISIDVSDFDEALTIADQAMYQAKKTGAGKHFVGTGINNSCHLFDSEIYWRKNLSSYLNENRLIVLYQPVYNLSTMEIEYSEALLRIPSSGNVLLTPQNFILAAEASGKIIGVDRWVFSHVMNRIKNGEVAQDVSINISAITLLDQGGIDFLLELADATMVASSVIIEITETSIIESYSKAECNIQRLREKGFRIALDDFGVGHSSFNSLFLLSIDILKIDGRYILDMENDGKKRAFLKGLKEMSKSGFGYHLVAECIACKETLDACITIGIEYGQGFYLAKPEARL